MLAPYHRLSLSAPSLTMLGLTSLPLTAHAQDKDDPAASGGANDAANKKIDLDLESTNLYYGL